MALPPVVRRRIARTIHTARIRAMQQEREHHVVELRQLEHFVAVAENGSFKGAAARCHIVQSGLSASIRALEAELGVRLFNRTTRHVELTDAGLALLEQANRTLAAAAAAREAVSDVEHLLRGTLTIGISWENDALDLPQRLVQFHLEHPQIAVNLAQGASDGTVERVAAGGLDLGFVYFGDDVPEAVRTETLASGSMVLACAPDHRFAAAEEVELEDLVGEDFVNAPRDVLSQAVDRAFEARGLVRANRFSVHSLETQFDLVAAGLGVAILPDPRNGGPRARPRHRAQLDQITLSTPPVSYVRLAGRPLNWTFASVLSAKSRPSPAARAFLDMLRTAPPTSVLGAAWPKEAAELGRSEDDEAAAS
jgi:DNA-binding transcriptional LysR family regulator